MVVASVLDPAWLGVIIPIALAVGGWFGRSFTLRRESRPEIMFEPLDLVGPGTAGPRPNYPYAVRVRVQNLGGPAISPSVTLLDPREEVFAEVFGWMALLPGQWMEEWLGIRLVDQTHDPTEEQAHGFLHRCVVTATCWDRYRRMWIFFPFGGHKVRRRERKELPWAKPLDMTSYLEQFPSRGQQRRGLGIGEPPDE